MLFRECIISILIIRVYCTEQQEAYFSASRIVWYFRTIFFYRSIQPVVLSFNGQTRYALLYGWKGAKMLSPISRSVFLQKSRDVGFHGNGTIHLIYQPRRRQHTTLGNRSICVKNLGENRLSTDSVSFRVTHEQLSRYRRYWYTEKKFRAARIFRKLHRLKYSSCEHVEYCCR